MDAAHIRKTTVIVEDTWIEGGRKADPPLRMAAAVAVLRNPWIDRGFEPDLSPVIRSQASPLGAELTRIVVEALGGPEHVEAYGKASMVGVSGEIEHGSAFIHTLRFGNHYRQAVAAKSYLVFTNTRGGPGAGLVIPMMHKDDDSRRSHYLSMSVVLPDAPAPDEILVALAGANGGRPHHRIGDRHQDLRELGHDLDNPAAV